MDSNHGLNGHSTFTEPLLLDLTGHLAIDTGIEPALGNLATPWHTRVSVTIGLGGSGPSLITQSIVLIVKDKDNILIRY